MSHYIKNLIVVFCIGATLTSWVIITVVNNENKKLNAEVKVYKANAESFKKELEQCQKTLKDLLIIDSYIEE